jgi:hypothetical protein
LTGIKTNQGILIPAATVTNEESYLGSVMKEANLKSQFPFMCLLLTRSVVAMDGFVPRLPKAEKVTPDDSHGPKGPGRSGIVLCADFELPNVLILFF